MVTGTSKALEKLREHLVHKCSDADIGFRVLLNAEEADKATYSIMLDRQHQEDEVIDLDGIKVFLEPAIACRVRGCRIDYLDEPDGGFFLSECGAPQELEGL